MAGLYDALCTGRISVAEFDDMVQGLINHVRWGDAGEGNAAARRASGQPASSSAFSGAVIQRADGGRTTHTKTNGDVAADG
jgi:hypothetical protein